MEPQGGGEYFAPLLAAIGAGGLFSSAWYAFKTGDRVPLAFAMTMNAWAGFLACLNQFALTTDFRFVIAAWALVVVGGLNWKEFNPRPSRRDRKLWRELMGFEPTLWELLKNDSRRHAK